MTKETVILTAYSNPGGAGLDGSGFSWFVGEAIRRRLRIVCCGSRDNRKRGLLEI